MKKLVIAAFALVLGAFAARAENLASLGIYYIGEGAVEVVNPLPKYVYVGKTTTNKDGSISFPCWINIDEPRAVELKFKVTGDLRFYASLYAFSQPGHKLIPLQCGKFEFNGKSVAKAIGAIRQWTRLLNRRVSDGDVITIRLELGKATE